MYAKYARKKITLRSITEGRSNIFFNAFGEIVFMLQQDVMNAYHFIAVTERMEESLGLLCHELGWEPFAAIPRHNTTEKRSTASELDTTRQRSAER